MYCFSLSALASAYQMGFMDAVDVYNQMRLYEYYRDNGMLPKLDHLSPDPEDSERLRKQDYL